MRQGVTQEIKNAMKDYCRDIHTAVPGKIMSFDPAKQEATVKPTACYRKPDDSLIPFPDIHEVPVYFPQGMNQKATIVWVVKPGDECMIFFAEQDLDLWRSGAESETDLRFDLTNAVCFMGLFAEPNPLVQRAYDNESIIIQREETYTEWIDQKIDVYTDGSIFEKADVNINTEAGADINIKAGAVINITAGTDVNIQAGGNISMSAGGAITLTASQIHLNP